MKKVGIICLFCFLFIFYLFNTINVNLKADEEINQNLFSNFVCEKVRECYYCIEVDGAYEISCSILLYTGTYNSNDAYILYSKESNQIIEYSFNSQHPWSFILYKPFIYILVFQNETYYYVALHKDSHMYEPNYQFYYDSVNYIVDNDFGSLFESTLEYDTKISGFNYSENIIKQNSISNSFYFENLNVNYGNNNNHTCSQLAISMYFAYVNEFLDNSILPNTLEFIENVDGILNTYSINKDFYYNEVYEHNYDITSFESPGANDLLHQFIIKYGQNIFGKDVNLRLPSQNIILVENYLKNIYNNCNVDIRLVSDFRYIREDTINEMNTYFTESYEYYESIIDRELLKKEIVVGKEPTEIEYQFDIFTEIDNGNPVVLFLTDDIWELNIDNYDNKSIIGYTELPVGHVAVVYGYVLTEKGIYYRCHFGHKVNNENYNNNDVWVKASSLTGSNSLPTEGFVIKKINKDYTNEESSYYYDNNGCIMNLPVNNVFKTYDEFAVSCGNVVYDDLNEYYYCDCDSSHLLNQQNHIFKYQPFNDDKHIMYCNCGYLKNESHNLYHHTFSDGHYELCEECSYNNPHPDGVTYEILHEMQHSWTCKSCNMSGTTSHDFYFESAGLNYHHSYCAICDYENLVPHGAEFDIWYYDIDEIMHFAHCSCCNEEWIENHTTYCPCLLKN